MNAAPGTASLLHGINLTPGTTVNAIKGDAGFLTVQTLVQEKIDKIKTTLKTELDLNDADFIDLPVLFMEKHNKLGAMTGYIAYTPGVVNMLVVTKSPSKLVLCIPKPFGPIVNGVCKFETEIRNKLPDITIHFIDDFTTYHMHCGEIHCGTNSQREPPIDRWWWELDWI